MSSERKMFKVELYVEVPPTLKDPSHWNWENIVNFETNQKNHSPVTFVRCSAQDVGTA